MLITGIETAREGRASSVGSSRVAGTSRANRQAPWKSKKRDRRRWPCTASPQLPWLARFPSPGPCLLHSQGGRGSASGRNKRGEGKSRARSCSQVRLGLAGGTAARPPPILLRHNSLSFPGSSSRGRVLLLSRREFMTQ